MTDKIKLFATKFSESWTACMLTMVQGNLTVLSTKHAITAGKVGIITGIAVVIASNSKKLNSKFGIILLTGVMTALADFIIHPSMIGTVWGEAVVTGIVAAGLAWILSKRGSR